jgi:hypothetical protein
MQTNRLIGGICEVQRCNGLMCHDKSTKLYKDCLSHSKVNRVDSRTQTTSLFLFSQHKESGVKL